MRCFVTGGAGFIGSNLAERLLSEGNIVTAYDDLSLGAPQFLRACECNPNFRFIKADLLNLPLLEQAIGGHEVVFHMAANSNIPEGRRRTDMDLRLGTIATHNVLEAMRRTGVQQIIFASTSAIYGEPAVVPTPEDYGPLFPISFYGASKLACEGLISAFCHNYGIQAWILRFANICGRHGTHGIIVDFIQRLKNNPRRLEIFGNGKQSKPYLHVSECVDGILFSWLHAREHLNYFNLGCEGATSAGQVAHFVLEALGLRQVEIVYGGGTRGWPGDVPQVRLACTKLERLGWKSKISSDGAVRWAVQELVDELACKPLC